MSTNESMCLFQVKNPEKQRRQSETDRQCPSNKEFCKKSCKQKPFYGNFQVYVGDSW